MKFPLGLGVVVGFAAGAMDGASGFVARKVSVPIATSIHKLACQLILNLFNWILFTFSGEALGKQSNIFRGLRDPQNLPHVYMCLAIPVSQFGEDLWEREEA